MSLGHYGSALLGILVCLGLQLWILRPAGSLRWARGSHHSLWLALARGLINGVGVTFGLTRQLRTEQGHLGAAQIRRITDIQSAVLSAASICLCALNSVGVPASRLLLLGLGLIGGAYYLATRLRYAAWQRRLRPGAAL